MPREIQNNLTQIDAVIDPLYKLLEFENYADPLFTSLSSLSWASITSADIISFFLDKPSQETFITEIHDKLETVKEALLTSTSQGEFPALLNTQFLTSENMELGSAIEA